MLIVMISVLLTQDGMGDDSELSEIIEGVFHNMVVNATPDPHDDGQSWERRHLINFEYWLTYGAGTGGRITEYVYIRWVTSTRLELIFFSDSGIIRCYFVDQEVNQLHKDDAKIQFSTFRRSRAAGVHQIIQIDYTIKTLHDGDLGVSVHTDLEDRLFFFLRHRQQRTWTFRLYSADRQPPDLSVMPECKHYTGAINFH